MIVGAAFPWPPHTKNQTPKVCTWSNRDQLHSSLHNPNTSITRDPKSKFIKRRWDEAYQPRDEVA